MKIPVPIVQNPGRSFGKVNEIYSCYRPIYPQQLFDTILMSVKGPYLDAVDLGAGTGISTRWLSTVFQRVTAIEPDKNMTKAGEFPQNVEILNSSGETAKLKANTYQLVTSGNAFYWMDAKSVLNNISEWLEPDGTLAVFRYDFPKIHNREIDDLINEHLYRYWDMYRHERLKDTDFSFREISGCSLFKNVVIERIPYFVKWDAEKLVGFLRSTSYVSKYESTLDNKKEYIEDLYKKIKFAAMDNCFIADMSLELILAENVKN